MPSVSLSKEVAWLIRKNLETKLAKNEHRSWFKRKFIWIGLCVVVVLLLALWYFRAWKIGKELARLKHEKDLLEEEKYKIKLDQQIKDDKDRIEEFIDRRNTIKLRSEELDTVIRIQEEEYVKVSEEISAIRNWNDVDAYLSKHKLGRYSREQKD